MAGVALWPVLAWATNCTITGQVFAPDGTPVKNGTVQFNSMVQQTLQGGVTVPPTQLSVATDSAGNMAPMSIMPGLQGQFVFCSPAQGGCGNATPVLIPVASTANIASILIGIQLSTGGNVIASSLNVSGNSTMGGTLNVTGATTLTSLTATGTTGTGPLTVTGNASISGTLSAGATTLSTLTTSGILTANGGLSITGHLLSAGGAPPSVSCTAGTTGACPTISGTDNNGAITFADSGGGIWNGTITYVFGTPFASTPSCVANTDGACGQKSVMITPHPSNFTLGQYFPAGSMSPCTSHTYYWCSSGS